MTKKQAESFFQNIDTEIEAEEQEQRKKSTGTDSETKKHPGGRPKSAVNRVQFTTKPKAENRRIIKKLAADYDVNCSDIIDILAENLTEQVSTILKERNAGN